MDVRNAMQAIESMHNCKCSLIIEPATGLLSSDLLVIAIAVSGEGTLPQRYQRISLAVPNRVSAYEGLPGKVYGLLLELDYKCSGQFWEQGRLPLDQPAG